MAKHHFPHTTYVSSSYNISLYFKDIKETHFGQTVAQWLHLKPMHDQAWTSLNIKHCAIRVLLYIILNKSGKLYINRQALFFSCKICLLALATKKFIGHIHSNLCN